MPVNYPTAVPAPVGGELNYAFTKGQRTTASIQARRLKPQYIEEIEIEASAVPYLALMEHLGSRHIVKGPTYFHSEVDWDAVKVYAGQAAATTDVTIYVRSGDGARIVGGQTLKNERTNEMMRVTAISVGTGPGGLDALTVTRGPTFNGSSLGTVLSGEELAILGQADIEGSDAPDPQSSEPALKTNAVQTFRQAWQLSGRNQVTDVYGTPEMKRIRKHATIKMAQLQEQTFLFSNGISLQDPYATGGFQNFCVTNVTDMLGNALTENAVRDNFIRPLYRRNNGEKSVYVFCGENARSAFDGFGLTPIRYRPDDEAIGIDVAEYNSSHGRVRLITHGLMTATGGSVTAINHGRSGYMFGINMKKTGQAIYKGRDTQELKNRQLPGVDGQKNELLADKGFWIGSELQHAIMIGIGG